MNNINRETPVELSILPELDFSFYIKDSHSGYFGPFSGIAERYAPIIARLEIDQSTGIAGAWNQLLHPIKARFSSRDERVQQLIVGKGLLGVREIEIAEQATLKSFPEQAYLISFLELLNDGQRLKYEKAELLSVMAKLYELS